MLEVYTTFVAWADDQEGASAVEYGLLVALITAIIIGVVSTLGGQMRAMFQSLVTALGG